MTGEKKCRACGKVFSGECLLRLSGMPGAVQNLPSNKGEAIASGMVLDVKQCSFCGLVQLSNDPVPYYKDVIRAGSFSPSMRSRQQDEFKKFIERFSLQGKKILEIGSGRGEYLSILDELSVDVFGMEHNSEFCATANEKGLKTFQLYPIDLAGATDIDGIVFDAFISINFLEHAPDPAFFIRSCANLMSEDGVGMIAVPDLEFELRDNYLFSFMSDHLSYFSSDSLRNILTMNGFDVLDIFRNKSLNVVTAYFKKRVQCDLSMPMEKFYDFNRKINDYLDSILNDGGRIALWGASHVAFSIISASKIANKISYIVDSHLIEDPVASVIIMCPEYSTEIVTNIKEDFSGVVTGIATFINGGLKIIQ